MAGLRAGVVLSCLASAALLALACGGSNDERVQQGVPTAQPTAIKTSAPPPTLPPAPTPLIAGPDVRPCTTDDVNVAASTNAATGGQLLLSLVFANGSGTACRLAQEPELRFLDAEGGAIVTQLSQTACSDAAPPNCVSQDALLLAPDREARPHMAVEQGEAWIELAWHIHDGSGLCPSPPPAAVAVEVVLPEDGGSLIVDVPDEGAGASEAATGIRPCDGTVLVLGYQPG